MMQEESVSKRQYKSSRLMCIFVKKVSSACLRLLTFHTTIDKITNLRQTKRYKIYKSEKKNPTKQ